MEEIRIVAVDFDGTLCADIYPGIGAPNLPLIALLKRLKAEGCQLILWTCRCGELSGEAVEWCGKYHLYFDAVNENVAETLRKYGSDSRKIFADVYIDDRSCDGYRTFFNLEHMIRKRNFGETGLWKKKLVL